MQFNQWLPITTHQQLPLQWSKEDTNWILKAQHTIGSTPLSAGVSEVTAG
jgi:hypothetical protein